MRRKKSPSDADALRMVRDMLRAMGAGETARIELSKAQPRFRGNPVHLEVICASVLSRDISIWNDFVRKQKGDFAAHLEGANLSDIHPFGAVLASANLRQACLADTDLLQANLMRANLAQADLSRSNLTDVYARGANMTKANFSNARMHSCDLGNSSMARAVLTGAMLEGSNLSGADLQEADLSRADLRKCTFDGAILTGCRLDGAHWDGWSIHGAKCDWLSFGQATHGKVRTKINFAAGEFEAILSGISNFDDAMVSVRQRMGLGHVFISYVREDFAMIEKLSDSLKSSGIEVWLDRKSLGAGVNWRKAIKKAIASGAYFVACFSENYYRKRASYMNKEVRIALEIMSEMPEDRVWLIPVRLSDVEIPEFEIIGGQTLRHFEYVDLWRNWDRGVAKIVTAIRG